MTRTDYRTARRLYRDNGTASLRWMSPSIAAAMRALLDAPEDPYDDLAFFFRSHKTSPKTRLAFRYYLQLRKD